MNNLKLNRLVIFQFFTNFCWDFLTGIYIVPSTDQRRWHFQPVPEEIHAFAHCEPYNFLPASYLTINDHDMVLYIVEYHSLIYMAELT